MILFQKTSEALKKSMGFQYFLITIGTSNNEKQHSAVEIQHADQPEKSDDNTEAEESFERDIAASEEAVKSQSFDDIIEDLSD